MASMNQKAGRGVNPLARASKCLDTGSKCLFYYSHLYYVITTVPVVWHFIGTEDAKKIERVQYRALKFVYNDFKANDFKASHGMLRERSGL